MTEPDFTSARPDALTLIALLLLVLGFFTVVFLIRRFIIIPKVRKDFIELHNRRIARARRALANEDANAQDGPRPSGVAQTHSFSAWLNLNEGGTVTIAGQTFRPGEPFAITARDANNIPRVKAAGSGQEVFIYSHGQNYRAKFTGTKWDVQLLEEGLP